MSPGSSCMFELFELFESHLGILGTLHLVLTLRLARPELQASPSAERIGVRRSMQALIGQARLPQAPQTEPSHAVHAVAYV